ncbi:MAG: LysM domain [Verrucomicrobiales bacterium]|nr:LysM domain [Verrucomicrobiales bacterium]
MTAFTLRRCLLPSMAGLLSLLIASCSSSGTKPPKSGYSDVVDYTTPHTNLSQEEYPFDKDGNYLADVVSGKKKGKPAAASYSSYSKPEPAPNPYLETYEKPVIKPVDTPPEKSNLETYEKPVITAVDTPPGRPNSIYERVPEPDTPPSSSSSGSSSGNSSSSRPKATASSTSAKAKPKSTATASASTKSKSSSNSKTASSSKSKAKAAPAKPKGLSYASHKVKNKDTLYSLAGRYNTTVSAIKKANGMSSNTLVNGRTLRIPRQ